MMPAFIPAADLRARTLNNRTERAQSEGRTIETPRALEAMVWTVSDQRVFWNGLNLHGSDEYMARGFRVVPGPLPGRFPYAHSQQSGRSEEIRARWRLGADILRDAMSLDSEISDALCPLHPLGASPREIANLKIARAADIKIACDVLLKGFVDGFWRRLDGRAKSVSFSAADVCAWIEGETESILYSHGGKWPDWATRTTQPVALQMAVAA